MVTQYRPSGRNAIQLIGGIVVQPYHPQWYGEVSWDISRGVHDVRNHFGATLLYHAWIQSSQDDSLQSCRIKSRVEILSVKHSSTVLLTEPCLIMVHQIILTLCIWSSIFAIIDISTTPPTHDSDSWIRHSHSLLLQHPLLPLLEATLLATLLATLSPKGVCTQCGQDV